MKKLLTLMAAFTVAAGASTIAQQADPKAPPAAAKPDDKAKPAASVTGKWTMAIDMQGAPQPMSSALEIKLDGKTVTGTITGEQSPDPLPIKGEFVDGKLSFSMTFDSQNGPVPITFNGALKENGTLAGTMDFGPSGQAIQVNWTAERVKEKGDLR